jgi:hypothetical protein
MIPKAGISCCVSEIQIHIGVIQGNVELTLVRPCSLPRLMRESTC